MSESVPLQRNWKHPSHPDIQEVVLAQNEKEFTSKSLSKISLPPFALYAKLTFPPCTEVSEADYSTVQFGKGKHLKLNSDLVYINHSCEPSLIFNTSTTPPTILAGPRGLHPGQELTFFYPSTEWEMAQPFDCHCGTPSCKGLIDGAGRMGKEKLEGFWLNEHIRDMLDEQLEVEQEGLAGGGNEIGGIGVEGSGGRPGRERQEGSSREMSGEMGGDTGVGGGN